MQVLEEERSRLKKRLFFQKDHLMSLPATAIEERDRVKKRIDEIENRLAEIDRKTGTNPIKEQGLTQVKLTPGDRDRLIDELNRLPNWVDGGTLGEKGVLRAAHLPEAFVNSLVLCGAPATDTPNVLTHLEKYGHLPNKPNHYAIGALAEYLLKNTPHVEGKVFLSHLIRQYGLITDSSYEEELLEEYGLLEVPSSDALIGLGWADPILSTWQGPEDLDQLERIWSKRARFLDACFLEKGARVARSVCRVESKDGSPLGTGFAVGQNQILTNDHVVSGMAPQEIHVRFGYRLDAAGKLEQGRVFQVIAVPSRSPLQELDYAILEVEGSPGNDPKIGFLELLSRKLESGNPVYIIQHPFGDPQKVVLQDNWVTYVSKDNRRVQYLTNTEYGSSGSPVCNEMWEVVALHHSRAPLPPSPETKHIRGNEGIPMTAILPEIQSIYL